MVLSDFDFDFDFLGFFFFDAMWGVCDGRCGCRFLRARKFDVPKAKVMLLSAEQWRKDEKVDVIARCVYLFFYFVASVVVC